MAKPEILPSHQLQRTLMDAADCDSYLQYGKLRDFDAHAFGVWQRDYGTMLDYLVGLSGKVMLDIGCAGGAITYAFFLHNATVFGCDVGKEMLDQTPFGEIKDHLFYLESNKIGERFPESSIDFIHSQQVFEHFPSKEYSEEVISQAAKLLKPDGIFYLALIAGEHLTPEELVEINRTTPIDLTHINIWSMDYWHSVMAANGLVNIGPWLSAIIKTFQAPNGFSYFREYHWNQLFYIKPGMLDVKVYAAKQLFALLEAQKKYADRAIYREVLAEPDIAPEMAEIIKEYV